jgi:hypothetical protein
MTGNVALDVVIGLVFVYLLYSLYATILMELISSLLGLRAKNLRYTLKRMLCDEKKYDFLPAKWLAGIATTFIRSAGISANLKSRRLYDTFMNQPNIKYLGSGGFGGRPSYISAENYSKALIDCIRIDNPELPQMANIEIGLRNGLKEAPETRKHIQKLFKDANDDPVKFKILLENWYNDTMERSTGWFKQTTQVGVLLIGLVLTISFNVDSIAIIRKLSTDKDARDQMVKLATDFNSKNQNLPGSSNNIQEADGAAVPTNADSAKQEELKKIKQSLEQEIADSRSVLQSSWFFPDSVMYHTIDVDSIHQDSVKLLVGDKSGGFIILHKMVDTSIVKRQFKKKDFKKISKDGDWLQLRSFWYKLRYVFAGNNIWGYLLTVLALSLGAPFWFDLLNKLVKLRTGKQAVEATDHSSPGRNVAAVNKDILNRVG